MKPLAFNISKMKKVSGDKHSTTFKHPDGHLIKVAHGGLPTAQRKQLEKLPVHLDEGGGPSDDSIDTTPGPTVAMNTDTAPMSFGSAPAAASAQPQLANSPMLQPGMPGYTAPTGPSEAGAANTTLGKSAASASPGDISVEGAIGAEKAAIKAKAQAEAGLADRLALTEQINAKQLAAAQIDWNQRQIAMNEDINNALKDVKNNYIDPRHYQENMSTTGKVTNAIGLLLGSFAGRIGQQNPAQAWLSSQIDRDINAQKANQESRINVYNGYLNQYKNAAVAENMARATQMGIYASKIREQAAKSASPIAIQNGNIAASELEMKAFPLVQNAHLLQQAETFNGSNGAKPIGSEAQYKVLLNAAQRINPDVYKDAQEKYIPGIGVTSHPADQKDRERLANLNELKPLIQQAQNDYGDLSSWYGKWFGKDKATLEADQNALQVSLNKLTGLNRLNDREYQNYGAQVGNLTGMQFTGATQETLDKLMSQAQKDIDSHMISMGVTPFGQAAGALQQQQQNQNQHNVQMKGGVKYIRQGNYMVPVK